MTMRTLTGQAVGPNTAQGALAQGLVIECPNGMAAAYAVEQLKVMLPALEWSHRVTPRGALVAVKGTVAPEVGRLAVLLLAAIQDRNEAPAAGNGKRLPWSADSWADSQPSQRGQKFMFAWGPSIFMTRWACPTCGGGTHAVKGQTLNACCAQAYPDQPSIAARWAVLADAWEALINGEGGSAIRLPAKLKPLYMRAAA